MTSRLPAAAVLGLDAIPGVGASGVSRAGRSALALRRNASVDRGPFPDASHVCDPAAFSDVFRPPGQPCMPCTVLYLALLASLCFGVGLWLQGLFALPRLGSLPALWLFYVLSVVGLLVLLPPQARSIFMPSAHAWAILAAHACSDEAYHNVVAIMHELPPGGGQARHDPIRPLGPAAGSPPGRSFGHGKREMAWAVAQPRCAGCQSVKSQAHRARPAGHAIG
jgi:hypothetical protein